MKKDNRKCIVCKKKFIGARLSCTDCLKKERKARLTASVKAILDNLYWQVTNKEIEIVDFKKEKIRTKYDGGKSYHPGKKKPKGYSSYLSPAA